MATTIASYYTDELHEWNEAILFYNEEIDNTEDRFADIIRRDSITTIADKVEAHQNSVNQVAEKFLHLQFLIHQQEMILKNDSQLLEDHLINEETEKQQEKLRTQMKELEIEYAAIKFNCNQFISDLLKK